MNKETHYRKACLPIFEAASRMAAKKLEGYGRAIKILEKKKNDRKD